MLALAPFRGISAKALCVSYKAVFLDTLTLPSVQENPSNTLSLVLAIHLCAFGALYIAFIATILCA